MPKLGAIKLSRKRDQRKALLKGLAVSFIENEKLTSTLPKVKLAIPFIEKLITKAKKGDLHARRQLLSRLGNNEVAVNKLLDEIAPRLKDQQSGYLRIKKSGFRKGDNAQLASIELVKKAETKKPKATAKKAEAKPSKNSEKESK